MEPVSNTKLSADVRALVELARGASPGNTVTYEAMSEAIGRNIQAKLYIWLQAQEYLAKHEGILFANVRSVGYQRLTTEELPDVGVRARTRIRRISRRSARDLTEASRRANDMPHDVQKKVSAEISTLKLTEHIASNRAQKKVEEDTEEQVMPLAKTMESLRQHLVG